MEYAYDGRAWTARSWIEVSLAPAAQKKNYRQVISDKRYPGYLALGRKGSVLITILPLLIYDFAIQKGLSTYYHITSTYLRLCDGREFVLSESTKKFEIDQKKALTRSTR